jgi:cyclophilin family peptidyl-prolyl cis-trans isomerase
VSKYFFFFLTTLMLIFVTGCGGTQTSNNPTPIGGFAPEGEGDPPGEQNESAEYSDSSVETNAETFESVAGGAFMEGCTVATLLPGADPEVESLFPPISEADWIRGPSDAAVTIVEYADFQSTESAQFEPVLALLQQEFPSDLRVVFRHFPMINIHDKAALAAAAAEAAGEQGIFWEMHDLLFQRQQEWTTLAEEDFRAWVSDRISEFEVNSGQVTASMLNPSNFDLAQKAFDDGVQIGIPGTPFLLLNGRIYDGPIDYINLSTIIKLYALQRRQFTDCPPMMIDPDAQYIATIQTEKGEIAIELLPDKAPLAVNNFVFLATNGWYDNITFHRVLDGFMAQAGDPSATGYGGPGYAFQNEISDLKFNTEGLLAMANAGPDSNGSQFFITLGPAPHLDGGFTIFGRVLDGVNVVRSISLRDPSQGLGIPPGDLILTITIEQK